MNKKLISLVVLTGMLMIHDQTAAMDDTAAQIPNKFSSGPCAKHPGWRPPAGEFAGRSHRSAEALATIQEVIGLQREILRVPENYSVGIVNGSCTGAMETLLWSLLGSRGIDVVSHCVFSKKWERDIVNELKLSDVRAFRSEFPGMADVSGVDFDRDVVFCWTSTTSGVSFQNADWIKAEREGLTICDAASAAFLFEFDWSKLDAMAFSWQKVLGGEAGIGTIILSPRAISRLESYEPTWPIPQIFRLAQNRKVNYNLFNGCTLNTISMSCVEDFRDALRWAKEIGGLPTLRQRAETNCAVVAEWVSQSSIFKFWAEEECRAHHIACLDIVTEKYKALSDPEKRACIKNIVAFCEREKSGFDFAGHPQTKPNLRIWCGPTIEADALRNFLPRIEEAYKACMEI
ncbi:MAG: phosphoserine transaminase [Holosporaceae bacterium]|jgi:phosphoserine aminotransferase|nr:phosphoserine transaminase [Holosporaceae bacterium]